MSPGKSVKRKASDEDELYKPPRMRKRSSEVKIKVEFESPNKTKDEVDDYLEPLHHHQAMDTSELELEEKVDTKPDWVEDDTVPREWKRRIFENNSMVHFNIPGVLAPDGMQYRSRQNAVRVLMKKNADPSLLEELRDCLVHEGWEEHELLPAGWRFRRQKRDFHRTKIEFLNQKAEMFKSLKETFDYLEKNYESEAVMSVQSLVDLSSLEMRVEGYSWREDDSVPPGWQMRVAEGKVNKEFFLSPDGQQFATRTVALQHMIREEYHEDDTNMMRAKLVSYENWQHCPDLPAGWLLKDGSNFSLLTSEGNTLESFCTAMEYMKQSDSYTEHDVELLRKIMEERTKEKRLEGYTWEEDSTVPAGWKSRRAQSKTEKQYFLSPDGLSFSTRFVAYQHLVKADYPSQQIEEMKQFLHLESWADHQLLPPAWKFKRNPGRSDINFLSEDGKFLRSFKIGRKHITTNYPEYQDNFDSFQQHESVRRRTSGYDWTENDPSVPEGWMIRVTEGRTRKTFLLDPDGVQYQSRRLALHSAVTENKDPELIDKLRSLLHYEGYESNDLLPDHWFYQYVSGNAYHIVRETGDTFESFVSALEFMRANDFPEEDIDRMEVFSEMKKLERRQNNEQFYSDPSLPDNWKMKEIINKRGRKRCYYLSSDGVQYASMRLALHSAVTENKDQELIEKLRSLLYHDGYQSSDLLPDNWFYQYVSENSYHIVRESGDTFESFASALEYLRANDYPEDDIDRMEMFEEEMSRARRALLSGWKEDPKMPPGWRSRPKQGQSGKLLFLSPDGVQHHSRLKCLQMMLGSDYNYSQQHIQMVKDYMGQESWYEHHNLPTGWMVNALKSSRGLFVTREGEVFSSIVAAKEFISTKEDYDASDIEKLTRVMEDVSKQRRQNNEDFYDDPSLPSSWRMKKFVNKRGKKCYFYLSPDGLQFACRRLALVHMMTNNYPEAQIKKMRSSLVLEGFEESPLLPHNWLIRYNPGPAHSTPSVNILTDFGVVFESFSTTSDMMRNNPNYSEDDIARLNKYLELKRQSRREKYSWSEDSELPPGWMFRVTTGSKKALFFLSPDNKMIQGRLRSCSHCLQSGDTGAAEHFKSLLVKHEQWRTHEHIPSGWLYKEMKNSTKRKTSHYGYVFLTREGDQYDGSRLALDHIRSTPGYTDSDAERLQLLIPARQAQRQAEIKEEIKEEKQEEIKVEIEDELPVDNPGEDLVEIPLEIAKPSVKPTKKKRSARPEEKSEWAEDNTVPAGWRTKLGGDQRKVYLSPDGLRFQTRRTALIHLLEVAETVSEVQIMRAGFALEGWSQDGYLPANWWYKYNTGRACFITQAGNLLQSMKNAADYIEINQPHHSRKFTKFENQMKKSD